MKKILVVDDEVGIRETLKALLKTDYAVVLASNGEEGVRHFQESSPDLVLLDLSMPKMDGMAALKKLRAISPEEIAVSVAAEMIAVRRNATSGWREVSKSIYLNPALRTVLK